MATFSKFYLDQDGVKALVAKIAKLYSINKSTIETNKALSEAEVKALADKAGVTLTLNPDGKTYTAAFADGSDKTLKALADDLRTDLGTSADAAAEDGSAFARIAANKANIETNALNIKGLRDDLGQKDDTANKDTAFGRVKDLEEKAFENVELTGTDTTSWKVTFTAKDGATKDITLDMSKFAIDGMLQSAELVHLSEGDAAAKGLGNGKAGAYLHLTFKVVDEKGIGDTGTVPQDIYVPLKDLIFDQHYKTVNSDDAYATIEAESHEVKTDGTAGDGFAGTSDHIDVTHTLKVSDGLKKAVDAVYGGVEVTDPAAAKDGSIEKRLQDAYTTLYAGQAVPADESKADDKALVKRVYDVEQWIANNALSVAAGTDHDGKDYEGLDRYFDAVVDKTVNGVQSNDTQSLKKGQWLPGIADLD